MEDNDLVFGYRWEDILAMQQGKHVHKPIHSTGKPKPTEKDRELLEKHGMDGLREMGFYGVIDRLT